MARTLLRALLTVQHLTGYEAFERRFRKAARELAEAEGDPRLATLTVSPRQFERWAAGALKSAPRPDTCRVLEAMFGQPVNQLLGAPPEHGTPPDEASCEPESGDRERKLTMAARRARAFSAAVDASNVGPESLEELRDEAMRLAVAYPAQPLTVLLPDLITLQDHTFTLLEGRQRPGQARDLYVIAGLASGMLAKASHDLRDVHNAMTHARAGLLCAQNAEHPPLIAWLRGLESLIKYWAAQPRQARQYAQAGLEVPGVTGTVRVWLASLKARAEAALGNADEACRAVEEAAAFREGPSKTISIRSVACATSAVLASCITQPRPESGSQLRTAESWAREQTTSRRKRSPHMNRPPTPRSVTKQAPGLPRPSRGSGPVKSRGQLTRSAPSSNCRRRCGSTESSCLRSQCTRLSTLPRKRP